MLPFGGDIVAEFLEVLYRCRFWVRFPAGSLGSFQVLFLLSAFSSRGVYSASDRNE